MFDLYTKMGKRAFDVVAATVGLVLATPILALALVASAATYRSWPLFSHERLGRHGRVFRFTKIRTLPPETGHYVDKYAIHARAIPRLMRLLRLVHIDEIPQLVHVVAGRMSIVGPRPEMAFLHARLPASAAETRLRVRPGVTGLWQVSPDCTKLIWERPEYDRLYVEHRGLGLDLWIMAATVRKIFLRQTTPLDAVPDRILGDREPDASTAQIAYGVPD